MRFTHGAIHLDWPDDEAATALRPAPGVPSPLPCRARAGRRHADPGGRHRLLPARLPPDRHRLRPGPLFAPQRLADARRLRAGQPRIRQPRLRRNPRQAARALRRARTSSGWSAKPGSSTASASSAPRSGPTSTRWPSPPTASPRRSRSAARRCAQPISTLKKRPPCVTASSSSPRSCANRRWPAKPGCAGAGRALRRHHRGHHPLRAQPRERRSALRPDAGHGRLLQRARRTAAACQLWLHGHLHCPSDYKKNGCRVVANPLGLCAQRRAGRLQAPTC
jgi:hypothetical protein